jgi:hypothetical protein
LSTTALDTGVPQEIFSAGPLPAPVVFTVAPLQVVQPASVFATFDGSGAGGSFLPCLTVRSKNGDILSRTFPQGVTLAPGDIADISYGPFLGVGASSSSAAAVVERISGTDLAVAANNVGAFTLAHLSGAALLDYTTPTNPTILTAGIYAVSLYVTIATAPAPALKFARIFFGSAVALAGSAMVIEGGNLGGPAFFAISTVTDLVAGQGVAVTVGNDDPAGPHTFHIFRYSVVKLA